jgi:hypothetical protein
MYNYFLINKNLYYIIKLLIKGLKFVPNLISNDYEFFKFILKEIDFSMLRFIMNLLFSNNEKDKKSESDLGELVENIRTPVMIALPKLKRTIDLSKFYLREES